MLTSHTHTDFIFPLLAPNPLRQNPVFPNPLLQLRSEDLPRHISLPPNLIATDPVDDSVSHEFFKILQGLFPGLQEVACDGDFLFVRVTPLPPKPWPKTIGGLSARFYSGPYLRSDQLTFDGKRVLAASRNGRVALDKNYHDVEDWDPLFDIIKYHFIELGISITEVIYKKYIVSIVLKHRNTDMSRLPARVAQVTCTYYFEDQMGRPAAPQARRQHDPSPGNQDESQYQTLRPGIRVSSTYLVHEPQAFISSTAGVIVKDQNGTQFLTVANHAFTDCQSPHLVHPSPDGGRAISELITPIGRTDIALVKLFQSEHFTNTTFQSTLLDESVRLQRLAVAKRRDIIYLDSPDTGCIEGQVNYSSRRIIPSDDPFSVEQEWLFTFWTYMGQDSSTNLPNGMCGSAIWKTNGDVVGFFEYAPKEGVMVDFCTSVGAKELINRGYTMGE